MGITARGAWESVKRHFRELGADTQTEDFTVVGVGDMSGDVFGNGMLLSEHIRLVAAFDHRHIFIDPRPGRGHLVRRAPPPVRPAALLVGRLQQGADLRGRRHLPALRQGDPAQRAHPRGTRHRVGRREDDAGRPDEGDPARAGRPAVERRHRHVREVVRRVERGRRRQGQRRDPRGRQGRARQGDRRGRQPRRDPAGPYRVRAQGRQGQHRRHRQQRGRGHLRPRGEHQDPAQRARRRRRHDRQAAQQAARRDDRRGRRPGAAQQLRAEHGPRQRRRPGARPAPRPPALHAPPGPRRATSTGPWSSCPPTGRSGSC